MIKASHQDGKHLPPLEWDQKLDSGEATELPFEFGWAQWDAAKRQQDEEES